ncbi:MAG: hypothetical protein HY000_00485 [Planctomycetes bacterium]|nr:hypothetical protein [Planctomycetota bacterium]
MNFRAGVLALFLLVSVVVSAEPQSWPPELEGAKNGTVSLRSELFLQVPDAVQASVADGTATPFHVARTPPTVDLAFQRDLGTDAVNRRLWSSWGDICVASDGTVYCGIGDHGNDAGGDARCFIYRWFPDRKELRQIVDMSKVVPSRPDQPALSKVHARIDEAPDGKIYFSCTLNDGNRARLPQFHWTDQLPGGQLYQYDPATGRTVVFADLPAKRCTATSLLDRERNIWWCNLEAGDGNALWGLNLTDKQVVHQSPDGSITFNRNFALGRDGSIYFNGEDGIWKYYSNTRQVKNTGVAFPDSPGMRSSTRESSRGYIYGTTHGTNQLFQYCPATNELELLGPTWLTGEYTAVTVLSPDERFLYYVPGAHGRAFRWMIHNIPNHFDDMSADGSTLYVNFNGHAADSIRPAHMCPNGFGLCAFAAIHIPEGARQ